MSTPSGAGKICVSCGEDVAAKPRTKDAKGRYYCTSCYDAAIAQKQHRRATTPLPKAPPTPRAGTNSLLDDAPLALDDVVAEGGDNVLARLIDAEPAHGPRGLICPSCRSQLAPGGFICTHCGFNLQTNEQAGAVRVKTQRRAGGAVWPPMVGIISIILGAGGVLVYGAYLVLAVYAALQVGQFGAALVSIIPVGTLLTSLAAWLLRDGIRILRRDSDGVKWIRLWALAKGLLYGTCFGVLLSIPPGPLEQALENAPGGGNLSVADIKSSILLLMLWYLAWPAFILVFFFVPRIQDDVEAWD